MNLDQAYADAENAERQERLIALLTDLLVEQRETNNLLRDLIQTNQDGHQQTQNDLVAINLGQPSY